jgi:uncharacterized protein
MKCWFDPRRPDDYDESMYEETLSPDRLRALLAAFKERHGAEYRLCALGYFGSYARNTATPESDVDIVFDTDAPNLFMTAMMKQDLEELFGRPVDVLQLRGLTNPRLKARIEKEAVYV